MDEEAKLCHIGLCVLCGLPGAGKSTLARLLKTKPHAFSVAIISYDDIIADVAFEEDPLHDYRDASSEKEGPRETSLWKRHRRHLLQCLEHLLKALLTNSTVKPPDGRTGGTWNRLVKCLESQGFTSAGDLGSSCSSLKVKSGPVYFILDDNFYYQSMRYEVFQLARKYSLGFCQLYVHCPVDCCILRNAARSNPVMDATIILMDSKLEKPNPEKNTWEKDSVLVDGSNGISMEEFCTKITNLMNQTLQNPVMPMEDDSEEKERDRDICAASVLHQADQNLRRIISQTMQIIKGLVSAKDLKQIAQELQQAKCEALDRLREVPPGNTVRAPTSDRISRVKSSLREDIDCIVQRYLQKVQADCPTAPS